MKYRGYISLITYVQSQFKNMDFNYLTSIKKHICKVNIEAVGQQHLGWTAGITFICVGQERRRNQKYIYIHQQL